MTVQAALETAVNEKEYSRAFLVSWRLVQLYVNPTHTEQIQAVAGEEGYLPGIPAELPLPQQTQLIWTRLDSDLTELPGGRSQEVTEAKIILKGLLENSVYDKKAIVNGIQAVFTKTLANVYVINPQLAKALILGRQLADLVFGPVGASADLDALKKQLSKDRVKKTCALLDELQSSFPLRATAAVSGSLMYWQYWVQARRSADYAAVRANLRSQGEQWRSLLTGEVKADDLLELRDYRQAFSIYVGQVADIYRKSPWLWGAFLALFAATGVGIWAIVHFAPKGAAVVAGIIVAGAGALGISWKTIAATAGKAAAVLERPLLADGLSEAVKIAVFIPPIRMTPDEITELRNEVRKEERRAKRKPLPAEQPRQAIAAPPEQPQLPAAGNEPEGATAR